MNSRTIHLTSGDFDYTYPETNTRRYFILEEGNLNPRPPAPSPNALQLLLNDDALASSCQSLGQYRSILTKKLNEIYPPTPTTVSIGNEAKLAVGVHANNHGVTVAIHLKQGDVTTALYAQDHPLNRETVGFVTVSTEVFTNPAAAPLPGNHE